MKLVLIKNGIHLLFEVTSNKTSARNEVSLLMKIVVKNHI